MGKPIMWVGLDVHARTIAMAKLCGDAAVPEVMELSNDMKSIRRAFGRLVKEAELRVCYEAGPCGFELQRQLASMGIGCEVIAPSLIPRKPGDRIKTDRRDAIKLARLFRAGELTTIVVPSADQEAARDLLRARDDVRKDRTAARHRLSKFLLRHGRHFREGNGWTQKHWTWIRGQSFERALERITFEHYVEQICHLDARMDVIDAEIAKLAVADAYRDGVGRLSCLRGISTLSAIILLAELGDLRRFDHPRQLMAYVGLVPSEHSSGDTRRIRGITKTGNGHVRRILVEATWSYRHRASVTTRQHRALAAQPPDVADVARRATLRLTKRYHRLVSRGKKHTVAATAVARELCAFVWALGRAA